MSISSFLGPICEKMITSNTDFIPQAMLKSESVDLRNKKIDSVWASIKNIPCKLTFWHK